MNNKPCLVCDNPNPSYAWTDYSGEGYCIRCGTTYQLKWGELLPDEEYPRCNVSLEWITVLRRFYTETKGLNGCGIYLFIQEYPAQFAGRQAFAKWMDNHPELVPVSQVVEEVKP